MVPRITAKYDIPCPIAHVLSEQEKLCANIRGGEWNYILFAEHQHVYTYVENKAPDKMLFRGGDRSALRAPLVAAHRGGSITYHGPGQLVCYFVFDLAKCGIGVQELNGMIEMSLTELLLHHHGIRGTPKPPHLPEAANGVWVRGSDGVSRKIASRGLLVNSEGVTRFGCALNVTTDLSWFDAIFPCGLDIAMTSVKEETGDAPDVRDTAYVLTRFFTDNLELLLDDTEKRRSN
ncbi:MAG: lipoyl(octanoyl) transferase LipB [Parcubacteria group bacterium]|nr:lipoyl(octanoyl) transferase LipB [Parcubacteria group bacterium]